MTVSFLIVSQVFWCSANQTEYNCNVWIDLTPVCKDVDITAAGPWPLVGEGFGRHSRPAGWLCVNSSLGELPPDMAPFITVATAHVKAKSFPIKARPEQINHTGRAFALSVFNSCGSWAGPHLCGSVVQPCRRRCSRSAETKIWGMGRWGTRERKKIEKNENKAIREKSRHRD